MNGTAVMSYWEFIAWARSIEGRITKGRDPNTILVRPPRVIPKERK